jgi:hypothetical protein
MPVWRLQTSIWYDSTLPRDAMVMTPHFNDSGVGTDPQGLCEDLADIIDNIANGTPQIVVRAYDAQGTPPVFPQGTAERNVGLSPASSGPREVALCLSFRGEQNVATQRGRLYMPMSWISASPPSGVRPAQLIIDTGPLFVTGLTNLGGADVDWVVYSRKLDEAFPVKHWWVDDEWDTVRRRGLRATTRTEGDVDE